MATSRQPGSRRCGHGTASDGDCGKCADIADEERWLASQLRQIDADQFALDARRREYDRRLFALTVRKRARSEATSRRPRKVKQGIA